MSGLIPVLRVAAFRSPIYPSTRSLGVLMLGSGGAMVLAKQRGIVPSVGDRLKRLQDAGLWISADVIALLKQKAGE